MKEEKVKVVLQIVEDKNKQLLTNIDCEISQLYGIVINLLGHIEEATGIEYNQLLKDLEDTKSNKKEEK